MKKFVLKKETGSDKAEVDYQLAYDKILNEKQWRAVFHQQGPALVIAGAGSGKTRTLTYRVARLVEAGVRPKNILLLTFTRRAAREMLNRAAEVLDERCRNVRGGTFHFYCSKLLHQYSDYIGYPDDFTILDTADAMDIIQIVRTRHAGINSKERFPQKKTLHSILSASVNKGIPISQCVSEAYPQFANKIEQIEEIAARYQEYKIHNRVMDFDDLLVKTKELLSNNQDIREKVASEHEHVMVDEFQDTNALQAELTELFSSYHNNVMAVGDDAQSIYSFRGADHRNIMDFPNRFSDTTIITLEQNYRSTGRILSLTNEILEQAATKYDKKLYSTRGDGEYPALVKAPNEEDQSRFVSQMVLHQREQGVELSDMAVLFRNGRDAYDLELELNRKNIPYVKYGGQKFVEAAHIKDVLAHVRVLLNAQDVVAWNRVLMLLEGVGPKTANELYEWIQKTGEPYKLEQWPGMSSRYREQIQALADLLSDLNENAYTPEQVLQQIVNYYRHFCERRFDDYPKRLKDLETFVVIANRYSSLSQLLEDLTLEPVDSTAVDTEPAEHDEEPMVLSTIHSAKGLEWKITFLIQCIDGVLPSGFSIDDQEQMEEELRLMYVACTRATDQLFVCYPVMKSSGNDSMMGSYSYMTQPSRFIENLSEDVLEPWYLVDEQQEQSGSPGGQLSEGDREDRQLES